MFSEIGTVPDITLQFIVNVTTVNIHATNNPVVATFPAYTLTKLAGTVFFQYLSQETPADKIQVVSFHPGVIPNDVWKAMGIGAEHCDDGKSYSRSLFTLKYIFIWNKWLMHEGSDDLPGSFAVWAASKEAAFLHGRTVWASWDVQELATGELRRRIDEDFYFLKTSVVGLDGPKMTRLA
jgi:NAD(P)-dependent dehydrogenase (short-subunit alcohol dehydrogenase family)